MKWVFKTQDLQIMVCLKFEIVGRGSDTQLEVGAILN